jgi:hypothetical protein
MKNQAAQPSCERHPWAVTSSITLKFNDWDFQAALRNGHDFTREMYIEILEGRADFIRFPGGTVVSYTLDESD